MPPSPETKGGGLSLLVGSCPERLDSILLKHGTTEEGPTITLPYVIVVVGVLAVSSASVIFKFATAEPLVVALYRMAFSALLLGIPILWRRRTRVAGRDLRLALVSGLFLAAHFATWFTSLTLTSVASSTILVSTHPFLVMAFSYLVWRERIGGRAVAGAAVAVAGAILVGWGDFRLDSKALAGDLLAFAGAVTVTGYFLIGRTLRQRMDAVTYSALAYSSAAVVLLASAVIAGNPLAGFEPVNWWIFAALAVFPTIFGHTLFNWALRFLSPATVSVSILGEPVGASLLAWLLWRTTPGPVALTGGVLILCGMAIFHWSSQET